MKIVIIILLFFLQGLIVTSSMANEKGAASSLGIKTSASSKGAFEQSIMIELPKERNSLQPGLSLSYSSMSGNSELGLGWSNFLSTISRTRTNFAKYNHTGGAGYLVAAEGDYFVPKVQKHFVKFKFLKKDNVWIQFKKNGTRTVYANLIDRLDSKNTNHWYIKDVYSAECSTDYKKCQPDVTYNYQVNSEQTSVLPVSVSYNKFNSSYKTIITFNYKDRKDSSENYFHGQLFVLDKLLQSIVVRNNGKAIKEYKLDYNDPQGYVSFSTLKTVEYYINDTLDITYNYNYSGLVNQLGDDFKTNEIDPKQFKLLFTDNSTLLDVDGDGLLDAYKQNDKGDRPYFLNDFKYHQSNYTSEYKPSDIGRLRPIDVNLNDVSMMDIDGDGYTDQVLSSNNSFFVRRTKGGKFETNQTRRFSTYSPKDTYILDMNSDGLDDYFRIAGSESSTCIINKGNFDFESKVVENKYYDRNLKPSNLENKVADLNGDGLLDIIAFRKDKFSIFLNSGSCSFNKPVDYNYEGLFANLLEAKNRSVSFIKVSDINNDGFADILASTETNGSFLYMGSESLKFTLKANLKNIIQTKATYIYDYDGDGTQEIVECRTGTGCRVHNLFPDLKPGLMLDVQTSRGQQTSVKYEASPKYNQDRSQKKWMPYPLPILSQLKVKDGPLATKTINYDYSAGYYDPTTQRFLGFSFVTEEHIASNSYFDTDTVFVPKRSITTNYNTGILYESHLRGYATSGNIIKREDLDDSIVMQYDTYEINNDVARLKRKETISGYSSDEFKQLILTKNHFDSLTNLITTEVFDKKELVFKRENSEMGGALLKVSKLGYYINDRTDLDNGKLFVVKNKTEIFNGNNQLLKKQEINYSDNNGIDQLTQESNSISADDVQTKSYTYDTTFPLRVKNIFNSSKKIKMSYDYDIYGLHVVKETNSFGQSKNYIYDQEQELLLSTIDENNKIEDIGYDKRNRIQSKSISKNDQLLSHETYDYIDHSLETPQIITANLWLDAKGKNKSTTVTYKSLNDKVLAELTSGPNGLIVLSSATIYNDDYLEAQMLNEPIFTSCKSFYKCDFNQILVSSPHKVKYYDEALRLSTVDWPLENATETFIFSMNENNRGVHFTDKLGHTITSFKDLYDNKAGKKYSSEEGEQVYSYDYDVLNQLISITMPSGKVRRYNLNLLGEISEVFEDNKLLFTNTYNTDGLLNKKVWSDGDIENIEYDLLDRPILKSYKNTNESVLTRFEYGESAIENNIGQIKKIVHPSGADKFSYNDKGLVTQAVRKFNDIEKPFVVNSSYNFAGLLTNKNLNGEQPINYVYDDDNWLQGISDVVTSLTWATPLKLSSYKLANSVSVNKKYTNDRLLLDELKVNSPSSNENYNYSYDAVSNVNQRRQSSGGTIDYTYNNDITYKLKGFQHNKNKLTYAFDIDNGLIQNDKLDRSDTGQIQSFQQTKYEFSANRRLKEIYKNGKIHTVSYDGSNLPTIESSEGLKLHHIDDNYTLVNGESQLRVNLLGQIVAEQKAKTTHFLVTDYINTPLEYFDTKGNQTNKVVMDPFGNYLKVSHKDDLPTYTSGMAGLYFNNESKTYSMGTRFYDPKAGEFVRMDQKALNEPGEFLDEQVELNLFQYAKNNPANYTDPNGEDAIVLSRHVALGKNHLFLLITNRPAPYRDVMISLSGNNGMKPPKIYIDTNYQNDENALKNNKILDRQLIKPPDGVSSFDFDERLIKNARKFNPNDPKNVYPLGGGYLYEAFGIGSAQNSNTFIDNVVEESGGVIKDFEGATGQNYGEKKSSPRINLL